MSFSYNCTEKHISSQISPGKEWCEQVNLTSPPLLNTSIRQIQILKSRGAQSNSKDEAVEAQERKQVRTTKA